MLHRNGDSGGMFVHICKLETLREYALAKRDDGSRRIDGVTFTAIEAGRVERSIEQIREKLVTGEYLPLRNWRREIPKDGGWILHRTLPLVRKSSTLQKHLPHLGDRLIFQLIYGIPNRLM